MTRDRIRVAFIGAGRQANWRHYPSVASMPDVELVAVCDLVPEKATETAKRWGIPKTYQDCKPMLEETQPDAVYVIMPPQLVFEPASYVLQQGLHLFIEKPPGVNLHQIKVLAHQAEQHNCLTMVA